MWKFTKVHTAESTASVFRHITTFRHLHLSNVLQVTMTATPLCWQKHLSLRDSLSRDPTRDKRDKSKPIRYCLFIGSRRTPKNGCDGARLIDQLQAQLWTFGSASSGAQIQNSKTSAESANEPYNFVSGLSCQYRDWTDGRIGHLLL